MRKYGLFLLLLSLGALVSSTRGSQTLSINICEDKYCDCKKPNKDTAGTLTDSVKAQAQSVNCKCLCGKKEGQACSSSGSHSGTDECEVNLSCFITSGAQATCNKQPMKCKGSFMKIKYDSNNKPMCVPDCFTCATNLKPGEVAKQKAKKAGIVHDFQNQCEMVKENCAIWKTNPSASLWVPVF